MDNKLEDNQRYGTPVEMVSIKCDGCEKTFDKPAHVDCDTCLTCQEGEEEKALEGMNAEQDISGPSTFGTVVEKPEETQYDISTGTLEGGEEVKFVEIKRHRVPERCLGEVEAIYNARKDEMSDAELRTLTEEYIGLLNERLEKSRRSLRDEFAMASLIQYDNAEQAYQLADEMLKQREVKYDDR